MTTRTVPGATAAAAVGGAVGGLTRHAIDVAWPTGTWPWATLTVNVVGAALLAVLLTSPVTSSLARRPVLFALLGAGFLGGFTTLSALSEQTRALVHAGHAGWAAAYVATSMVGGTLAVIAVRRSLGRREAA